MGADRAHPGGAGAEDEGGGDGLARGEEEGGGAVANIQDPPPEVQVHLRPLLQKESHQQR